jgi:hypothetical protein
MVLLSIAASYVWPQCEYESSDDTQFVLHFEDHSNQEILAPDTNLQEGAYNPVIREKEGSIMRVIGGHKGLYLKRNSEVYVPPHDVFSADALYVEMLVSLRPQSGAFFLLGGTVALVTAPEQIRVYGDIDGVTLLGHVAVGDTLHDNAVHYIRLELTRAGTGLGTGRLIVDDHPSASFSWTPLPADREVVVGGALGEHERADMLLFYLKISGQTLTAEEIADPNHFCKYMTTASVLEFTFYW